MVGYSTSKKEHLARLRRIEGQVRGLQRMVDDEVYCIDVLTQIASVTKALQRVGLGLLDEHVRHCVVEAAAADGEGEDTDRVSEAVDAVARLLRS